MRPRQVADRLEQFARQVQRLEVAGRGLLGPARPVGGQLDGFGAVQLLAPVGQLRLRLRPGHVAPLPAGVVDVADVGRAQARRLAGQQLAVAGQQFAHEDAQRPAVGHQVVHADCDDVLGGPRAEQPGAQQRFASDVERRACQLRRRLERTRLRIGLRPQVDHGQREGRRIGYLQFHLAAGCRPVTRA